MPSSPPPSYSRGAALAVFEKQAAGIMNLARAADLFARYVLANIRNSSSDRVATFALG